MVGALGGRLAVGAASEHGIDAALDLRHFSTALGEVHRFVTVAAGWTVLRATALAAIVLLASGDVDEWRLAVARKHFGILAKPMGVRFDFLLAATRFFLCDVNGNGVSTYPKTLYNDNLRSLHSFS